MTKQLMTWARSVSGMGKRSGGMEFSSQQALQSYLREHPKADMSKHSVAQPARTSADVTIDPSKRHPFAAAYMAHREKSDDPHFHAAQAKMLQNASETLSSQLARGNFRRLIVNEPHPNFASTTAKSISTLSGPTN